MPCVRSNRARLASASSLVVTRPRVAERAEVLARKNEKQPSAADAADRT